MRQFLKISAFGVAGRLQPSTNQRARRASTETKLLTTRGQLRYKRKASATEDQSVNDDDPDNQRDNAGRHHDMDGDTRVGEGLQPRRTMVA